MCDIAHVNVAIFEQFDGTLQYVDGVFEHEGRPVCVKLLSIRVGRGAQSFRACTSAARCIELACGTRRT